MAKDSLTILMREPIALTDATMSFTHQEMRSRLHEIAGQIPLDSRSLVLMSLGSNINSALWYLACLSAGHVPILISSTTSQEFRSAVVERFKPALVIDPTQESIEVHRGDSPPMHDDLAVLLGTSGSTGAGRFVRLSRRNLLSNARSIAQQLPMKSGDIALTNLPLSYSYGLSVLHSNLLAGHGVALTDLPMSDLRFWNLAQAVSATSIHTVPYGFELAGRLGFPDLRPTTLRYATSAGGRMPAEELRELTMAGRRQGWQMIAMYGQTEATARMAILQADEALHHPESIGTAVPGGKLWVDADIGTEGEIKYRGPNVMMGYAQAAEDLQQDPGPDVLNTGDLAICDEFGVIRVVGRSARFAKINGARISLDEVEQQFAQRGIVLVCVDDDSRIGLVVKQTGQVALTHDEVLELGSTVTQQHRTLLAVAFVTEFPRLSNGKLDLAAARSLLPQESVRTHAAVTEVYARIFAHEVDPHDSFNSLGGDSLNYVDASVSLEDLLGPLPHDWPNLTVEQLQSQQSDSTDRAPGLLGRIETSVLIRAFSIICIVCSHAGLFTLRGGAHALIAVAGYNMARFQLSSVDRIRRVKRLLVTAAAIAVPSMIWIALVVLARRNRDFNLANIVLLNNVFGPDTNTSHWRYWAIEAIIYLLLGTALLMAIPWVNRADRRWPFALPLALVLLAWILRYFLLQQFPETLARFRPEYLITVFVLGWAIARARNLKQRLTISAVTVVTMFGYFETFSRAVFVMAALLALIWIRSIAVLRLFIPALGVLASASLYIYLVHWQIFPTVKHLNPVIAVLASFLVGIAVWQIALRLRQPIIDLFAEIPTRRSSRTKRSRPREVKRGSLADDSDYSRSAS